MRAFGRNKKNDKCQNPKLQLNPNDKYPKKNPDASTQGTTKAPIWSLALRLGFRHLGFGIHLIFELWHLTLLIGA
jgi:hypothetical protein